jgi:hypothetical protein
MNETSLTLLLFNKQREGYQIFCCMGESVSVGRLLCSTISACLGGHTQEVIAVFSFRDVVFRISIDTTNSNWEAESP